MQETFGFGLEANGVGGEPLADEEANGGKKDSDRSQETQNQRDDKNATVEMTVKP